MNCKKIHKIQRWIRIRLIMKKKYDSWDWEEAALTTRQLLHVHYYSRLLLFWYKKNRVNKLKINRKPKFQDVIHSFDKWLQKITSKLCTTGNNFQNNKSSGKNTHWEPLKSKLSRRQPSSQGQQTQTRLEDLLKAES